MGMVLFMITEAFLDEQTNVPAHNPGGVPGNAWANVKLNEYHFISYWFRFWFCSLIWAVVPLICLQCACMVCGDDLNVLQAVAKKKL